jgi:predicted nuclease with TOPRIM domain
MGTALTELPNDVESLKKLVVDQASRAHELEAASKQLKEEHAELQLTVQKLKDHYELLQQKFFGSSSEQRKKRTIPSRRSSSTKQRPMRKGP